MPTRNIVLTERQTRLVERLVKSGRYQNASEVLRDGLRLIETRDAQDKAKLSALRDAARAGLSDIDSGRYREFTGFDELEAHLREITQETLEPQR